jgi:Mrp family chromosome partitioning ATPase
MSAKEQFKANFLATPNPHSNIKKIFAIVSGKGGVGKSLVTSLTAVELRRRGYNVGILDADITGPSIPQIFQL